MDAVIHADQTLEVQIKRIINPSSYTFNRRIITNMEQFNCNAHSRVISGHSVHVGRSPSTFSAARWLTDAFVFIPLVPAHGRALVSF